MSFAARLTRVPVSGLGGARMMIGMGVPASKTELLSAMAKTFDALTTTLDSVPPDAVRSQVIEGHVKGTMISPADLVAYLIGWNRQVLTWLRRRSDGLPDEFPAAGVKWNELGILAQRFYAEYRDESWTSLRAQLVDAKNDIVAVVESSTDDDLYGAPWYGKWPLGRMISLNTSSPYTNARKRLRSWLKARSG